MMTNLSLGERVREARHKRGYTQERAAEELGISRVYLAQIERGAMTNVSLRIFLKLDLLFNLGYGVPHLRDFDWDDGNSADVARRKSREQKWWALEMLDEGSEMKTDDDLELFFREHGAIGDRPVTLAEWREYLQALSRGEEAELDAF